MSSITPRELKSKLGRCVLIDVRNAYEHLHGSIEGSINIPLDQLEQKIAYEVSDKNEEIVVYCRSGNRSSKAVDILEGMGYRDVSNLEGGFIAWELM